MLHFPLLSDAYEAALVGADPSRSAAHQPLHPGPCPIQPEQPEPALDAEEERDDTDPVEDLPDDMETARTRPLRLDRFRI